MDLIDFFRGRHSWRKLHNILTRLPLSSHYRTAVLDDPEVAEQLAAQPEPKGQPRPALSEFGPEVALLTDIKDRLAEVIAAVISTVPGSKPPKIPQSPRPTTGVAKARKRLEDRQFAALEAEFLAAQERWAQNQG